MAICNGCYGVIGRDCFNPIECEQISRSIDIEDAVKQELKRIYEQDSKRQEAEYYQWCEKYHNGYPGAWHQPLFDYMAKQHNVILVQSEMDEIISIVNTIQATAEQNETK